MCVWVFPFNQEWVATIASHPGSPERSARGGRPKVTDVLEVDEIVSLGGLQLRIWGSSWDEQWSDPWDSDHQLE
jgi:hypothetical protein